MKNKIKKIGAFVCALIVFASCFVVENYIADDNDVVHVDFQDYLSACGLPQIVDCDSNSRFVLWDEVITKGNTLAEDYGRINVLEIVSGDITTFFNGASGLKYGFTTLSYVRIHKLTYNSNSIEPVWESSGISEYREGNPIYSFAGSPSNVKLYYTDFDIYTDSSVTDIAYAFNTFQVFDVGVVDSKPIVFDKYNPSLGYLQNIKFQMLYLEDDKWDMVEDTAVYKYSFSAITTTGLDITEGDWKVRHFKQLEIRDLDDDKQIHIYDKVFCNEYSASELKVMYPYKETNEKVHSACGFEGLSWWELEFQHYYMFYNDYLQLVRVNDDGSVDYGGCVRVWRTSNNITYTETLDDEGNISNEGYVDSPISGTHGSGGTYEEAEDDALENEENKIKHDSDMSELESALSGFTSTLGVIPSVIGSVFSFLPPWCLNLCGVTFGLLLVLIVWKVVRG